MLGADHWQVLAESFADRMLNSVLEGTALTLFGWILVKVFRKQNSSTRFAVWFSCLVGIAVLPFFHSATGVAGSVAFLGATHPAFWLPSSWAFEIFMVWAVIAGAGLAKISFGFWQLKRLRRSCRAIDPTSLDTALQQTLNAYGSSRAVAVCTSDRVRVPAAIGFLHPAIVFPPWAWRELSTFELDSVLLHELAHLQRRDDWTNLAQEILRAIFFFHPALWLVGRGLSLEREMACDDFVLAGTSNARAYAQCLVSVAEKSFLRRGLALAQAVAGKMRDTTRRVVRILDADRPKATRVQAPALGLVVAFSLVCLFSLPRAPKLVAFDGGENLSVPMPARVAPASFEAGMGAKMIPAALHLDAVEPEKKVGPAVVARALPRRNALRAKNGRQSHLATAKFIAEENSRTAISPRSINLSYSNSEGQAGYPNAMLLVIHTEEADSEGRVWSISVMQLTVFHPTARQIQKETVPKKT
jgi:beta-lactamase regulating signal transducer with metallopeptidase domain